MRSTSMPRTGHDFAAVKAKSSLLNILTHHEGSVLSVHRDRKGIVLMRWCHGQMVVGSMLTLTDNEARALIKALRAELPNRE